MQVRSDVKKIKPAKKSDKYGGGPDLTKDDPIIPVPNDRSYIGYTSGENFSFGEEREFKANPVASKFAFDLYKEEDAIVAPVVRIKHIRSSSKSEKWKIFENAKVMFIIDGSKLTKKEKLFLQTSNGISWLLLLYKNDIKSFGFFKIELKKKLAV